MWLIGQEWKCSNVWSGLILIGRGLDLNELGKVSRISIASSYCSVLKVQPSFLREEKKAKEASLSAAAGTGVGAFEETDLCRKRHTACGCLVLRMQPSIL